MGIFFSILVYRCRLEFQTFFFSHREKISNLGIHVVLLRSGSLWTDWRVFKYTSFFSTNVTVLAAFLLVFILPTFQPPKKKLSFVPLQKTTRFCEMCLGTYFSCVLQVTREMGRMSSEKNPLYFLCIIRDIYYPFSVRMSVINSIIYKLA